ncbi:hypothetical protein NDU88_000782 [Pleurodeles waltl]|uniref:Uncharacterized protein n=1 Tax=Pleurodeles waltl TaxID=8319 RepID=A0AAV7WKP1_PLEWA|nr:hypothetical protein NDU88_000782 [Pleurodeles waltl]
MVVMRNAGTYRDAWNVLNDDVTWNVISVGKVEASMEGLPQVVVVEVALAKEVKEVEFKVVEAEESLVTG